MRKILHTIASMGVKSGGTSSCLYNLLLKIEKYDIDILSYKIREDDSLPGNELNIIDVPAVDNKFKYSHLFKERLLSESPMLYHTHGLWEYTELITAKIARKKKIPYIITPHGMLYPEALNHSRLRKTVFLKLFLFNDLNKASAIHATCNEEMVHLRNLGIKAPVAVIPNSVEVPPMKKDEYIDKRKIKVGYLGRIHPRKNIDRLIKAWSKVQDIEREKELVVIGSGNDDYLESLKILAEKLELDNVTFTGFLSGKEKEDVIKSLSYLVVPSDFENFGMIIPEALVLKVPVIASKGTPWKDLEDFNCGWWVDNDIETLITTLKVALHKTLDEQVAMGENGRKLVEEKYSLEAVSSRMEILYDWIINGGEKPDFVYL